MASIEEVLKPYISNNQKTQNILNQKLYIDLKSVDHLHYIKMLFLLIEKKYGGVERSSITAYDIISLCRSLNINTSDELISFDLSKINIDMMIDIINPKLSFSRDDIKSTSGSEIKRVINEKDPYLLPSKIYTLDRNYRLLSMSQVKEILDKSTLDKIEYTTDSFDCENYARNLASFCSIKGFANSIGVCFLSFYDKNNDFLNNHACNIAVLDTFDLILIEPQTDQIITFGENAMFGTWSNTYKLYEVQY